jgi:hypothetical protein
MAEIIDNRFRKVMYRPKGSISEITSREELNAFIQSGDVEQKIVNTWQEQEDALDSFFSVSPEQLIGYKKQEFAEDRIKERSVISTSAHYVDHNSIVQPVDETQPAETEDKPSGKKDSK